MKRSLFTHLGTGGYVGEQRLRKMEKSGKKNQNITTDPMLLGIQ